MKKIGMFCGAVLMLAGLAFASPKKQTFTGTISDSMCGAQHMGGSPKDCTLKCLDSGSKFVLVEPDGKVYQLSNQKTPRPFAGESVKVMGTLHGDTIAVSSISAGK